MYFLIYVLLFSLSVEGDVDTSSQWVNNKSEYSAKILKTKEDFDAFVTNDQVVVIGFFKDADSEEADAFKEGAKASDDAIQFGITSNSELLKKVHDQSIVILLKHFDEGMNKLEGEITTETITDFVNSHSFPLIVEFDPETGFKSPINLFLIASAELEAFEEIMINIKQVAKDVRSDLIRFVYVNTDEENNERILKFLEIEEKELPTFLLTTSKDKLLLYKPDDSKLSSDNIRSFINNWKSGNENHVKVLDGSSFTEAALDTSKVLLEKEGNGKIKEEL